MMGSASWFSTPGSRPAARAESSRLKTSGRAKHDPFAADLEVPLARRDPGPVTYPAMFAIAAHHRRIAPADALKGLMWSVVEAQVAAAMRLVPLGHTAGQRILIIAVQVIERAAENAASLRDDEIGNVAPAMAMASAWHDTQPLFRSNRSLLSKIAPTVALAFVASAGGTGTSALTASWPVSMIQVTITKVEVSTGIPIGLRKMAIEAESHAETITPNTA